MISAKSPFTQKTRDKRSMSSIRMVFNISHLVSSSQLISNTVIARGIKYWSLSMENWRKRQKEKKRRKEKGKKKKKEKKEMKKKKEKGRKRKKRKTLVNHFFGFGSKS